MRPLAPLNLPLDGQVLIEASAGTGKTYTIGILFLRMLLERELDVDQILVMTYTRAATQELRDRIRARIREALDVLNGASSDDALLQDLAASVPDPDRARILLRDGLTRMDEASIFTIHSFCQRMLQEHAFESDGPFEMEFLDTEHLLRARIMEDFWRQRFYAADPDEAAWAVSLWTSPTDLMSSLGGHLGRPDVNCVPVISESERAVLQDVLTSLFEEVRTMWLARGEEITALLSNSRKLSRNNTSGYGERRLAEALDALEIFLGSEKMSRVMPGLLELFTATKINDPGSLKKKVKEAPPDHPFFDLFDEFFTAHLEMGRVDRITVLQAARQYLHRELVRRKAEQGLLYYDDLLTRLAEALGSAGGARLAAVVSRRFPVILVDEFQDTDPLQYRIFTALHRAGPRTGLFLIGDPKQAIYGFRGADIFTYIRARLDTHEDNRFTMTANYRSTAPMVDAVNRLFDRKNSFLFSEEAISFSRVRAAGMADGETLLQGTVPLQPLTCLLLEESPKVLSKDTASMQAARFCAREIAGMLADDPGSRAAIGRRRVTGGDIAVLVRTHREADLIRRQLNRAGVNSVYYSRDSVFESPEARQLVILLNGLIRLSDPALVRTLLTTDPFGYTAEQLDHLNSDEQAWEEIMTTLGHYRQLLQQQGFSAMFYTLVAQQKMIRRLHGRLDGERMLTNFLHLTELLQEATPHQAGPEGLLRWLVDRTQAQDEQGDSQQLRLESDENLVKIVTIHKAKGLEYQVVFLPFLWSARPCNPAGPFAFHPPEHPDRLYVDLGSNDPDNYQLAENERLAEDLRLLYVAVTRARYGCFFCWGRVSKMEESALCYLLHGGTVPEQESMLRDLEPLPCRPWPGDTDDVVHRDTAADGRLQEKKFTGTIDGSWQITSYSRLTAGHDLQPERPDYDRQDSEVVRPGGRDIFGFPRGAAAGTCLHAIFEKISFTGPAGREEIIREELDRSGFGEAWIQVVSSWIEAVLNTELMPGFSLSGLEARDRVNEMAFSFPLESMDPSRFNRVLDDFGIPPLPDQQKVLQGLMVGFIDLVFRRDGRYFVADYKSNYLGPTAADYNRKNLRAAMLEHRYDLQYLIYTLALHRFLGSRIQGYDYDAHFGGVCYLFLRGTAPEHPPGNGIFFALPDRELIEGLDRCCRGKQI